MKYALILITFSLSACSLFEKKPDEPSIPTQPKRGVFHPGPYRDPETGKFCNAPGGFCGGAGEPGDKRCHSSPDKCPAQ